MGLFNRSQPTIAKNAAFSLTNAGREWLINYMARPEDRVLAALETCGSSDRDEIARASGLNRGSVERHTLALLQKGFVQQVGQGSSFSMGMDSGVGDDDGPMKRRMRG